jgi:hypothetical protein
LLDGFAARVRLLSCVLDGGESLEFVGAWLGLAGNGVVAFVLQNDEQKIYLSTHSDSSLMIIKL